MISPLIVLNTVTAQGTDLNISTSGVVSIAGSLNQPWKNIVSITKIVSVAETKQVWTITPTFVASTTYKFVIEGFSKTTGLPMTVPIRVTSPASGDASTVCDLIRTELATQTDLNVVATGTSTVIMTATGINSTYNFPWLATFVTLENDANIALANTTPGVEAVGTVAALQYKYTGQGRNTDQGYSQIANLTSGQTYTEYDIVYTYNSSTGGNTSFSPINQNTFVVLIQEGVTNFDDLAGTFGTLTGLDAGKLTTISAVTTAANKSAAITVTTGVVTLSGTDSPTYASEDIETNDVINIGGTAGTYTRIQSILTQTTAVGTTTSAVSAAAYRVVKNRPLNF